MTIRLWSLPERRELIRRLRDAQQADYQHQEFFQGRQQKLDVYTVDIGMPCYRLSNGRTRSAQKEIVTDQSLADDFFSADPDSEPALAAQDAILREMVSQAGLLKILQSDQQNKPLILDTDGYVVNGNRRLCAMRMLVQQDEGQYQHFKHVQVVFLPPAQPKDIKELEGRLQVAPEGRAEYSWIDEAMLYRDLRDDKWSEDEIASLYGKKVGEVREPIAMLEDAERFLASRGKQGRYSLVLKKEYAFKQLQKCRKSCADDEPKKQLLTAVADLMIDDADGAEGRLYESIPDAFRYLDDIARVLQDEIVEQVIDEPAADDGLDILGNGDCAPLRDQVLEAVKSPDNAATARAVVKDVIEEMRASEKERKDATYCLRQVQQAYTRLQSSLSAFDTTTQTSGMAALLANIDSAVRELRERIKQDGDTSNPL